MSFASAARREELHRRGLRLEWFTVAWNMVEGVVAIGAGLVTGSVSLVAFGADSCIEVISAVALLWRLRKAGPHADAEERGAAERRALYLVAATFFLLAAYITFEALGAPVSREGPESSVVGLVLSIISLLVMPILAYGKQRTGRAMGSEALQADAVETWVCSYLSLALLAGVGLNAAFGWWWAVPVGALAMLPVIIWQGWETLGEAREEAKYPPQGPRKFSRDPLDPSPWWRVYTPNDDTGRGDDGAKDWGRCPAHGPAGENHSLLRAAGATGASSPLGQLRRRGSRKLGLVSSCTKSRNLQQARQEPPHVINRPPNRNARDG
jgi:hypothetical protein